MRKLTTLVTAIVLTCSYAHSQTTKDSLAGFDETAAIKSSISEGFLDAELKVHLNQMKRRYINDRYALWPEQTTPFSSFRPSATPACVNEDFEASSAGVITSTSQISGWTIMRGANMGSTNNSCNQLGCCTTNPSESNLIVAPNGYTDAIIGSVYPIYSVFGSTTGNSNGPIVNPQITGGMFGDNFIRLNSGNAGDYSMERLSKSFMVSSSNALFNFAFISVQACGHSCCDAGGIIIKFTDVTTNSFLASLSYSSTGVSSSCTSTTGVNFYNTGNATPATTVSTMVFNKWHVNTADLSPYIGDVIMVEVIATDCTAGGHFGYGYFDAQCSPFEIQVNGQNKNSSCSLTATVSAPANFGSYQWAGPSGFTSTQQSFTTTVAGVYSVTIAQNPPYQSLQKTLNLVISPASVSVTSSHPVICPGNPATITATGLSSYSWNTGSGQPAITVHPNSTTTYTVSGTNSNGCQGIALFTQTVSNCTAIENNSTGIGNIILFPNPNNGTFNLNISSPLNKGEVIIKNALGAVVHIQPVSKGENTIKTKNLATGLYYFVVLDDQVPIGNGSVKIE